MASVRRKLSENFSCAKEKVYVVENSVSSVFLDRSLWKTLDLQSEYEKFIKIGYVASGYPHKNHLVLAEVCQKLKKDYDIEVKFFVTLEETAWKVNEKFLKDSCINMGPINLSQCPSFYEKMDAIIFPSLMECFSAAPLEALFMKRPLFASDRDFVRETCGSYAFYFNPLSSDDIAKRISSFFKEKNNFSVDSGFFDEARQHAFSFSSSKKRTEEYLSLINYFLFKERKDSTKVNL